MLVTKMTICYEIFVQVLHVVVIVCDPVYDNSYKNRVENLLWK